jgi:prepilin-type N-terminal cleavage/methylation domain-containing protein
MPAFASLAPVPARRSRGGFTLIEILVVVAILVVLVALLVTVGRGARESAQIRQSHLTLHTVDGAMKHYLAAGNPEPVTATDAAGTIGNPGSNADLISTIPNSDATRWVKALRAFPDTAKAINNLPTSSVTDPDDNTAKATVVLDAFGTPIRYVPTNTANKKDGYFESAGADRIFFTVNPQPTNKIPPDDLYSTDPS